MIQKNIILAFLIAFYLCSFSQPTTKWVKDIGSPDNESPSVISSDNAGNIYVGGSYFNNLTMCSSVLPQVVQPPTSNQTLNLFLTKYDSLGGCIWTKVGISSVQMVNSGAQAPVISDLKYYKGAVYCVGNFTDKMIFGNDTLFNPACSTFCASSFVIKFDSLGNTVWSKCFQTSPYSSLSQVIPYDNGIFISGTYHDTISIDTVQLNTPNTSPSGYLIKLNNSGKCKWGKNIGVSKYWTSLNNLVYDKTNYLYMQGKFYDSIAFPSITLTSNSYYGSTFFAKYDTLGNFIWAKGGYKVFGGGLSGHQLCFNNNNIFLSGLVADSVRFGINSFTISPGVCRDILTKMDTSGNFIWVKLTSHKYTSYVFPSSLDANQYGCVLFSNLKDTVIINSDTLISSSGSQDCLISQFDNNGNVLWNKRIGGNSLEFDNDIHCNGISIYIGAMSYSNYSIDSFTVTNKGYGDILLTKFNAAFLSAGITDQSHENSPIVLFPNPNNGVFKVNVNSSSSESIIHVYNCLGQQVISQKIHKGENSINLSDVAKGIYNYMIIKDNNTKYNGKLVIY